MGVRVNVLRMGEAARRGSASRGAGAAVGRCRWSWDRDEAGRGWREGATGAATEAAEATYSEPPNFSERFQSGEYTGALFGHGGSYSSDIYYSLRLYQTASTKIPGGHLVNFSRWHNDEYDALVDQLYGVSPTDMEAVMEIWNQAMAIWIPEYPDIQISQGLHRLPMNTTYWTNWPTAENPYVNPAHWRLTWPYVMHQLLPASEG